MDLPNDAAAVFRVPPADFVATRDALVGRLLDDGRDDDAAAVKKLRKPTVVVWALNQVADRAAEDVTALREAGRDLRAAQQAVVSAGGDAERLREAAAVRRAHVARLTEVARTALAEVGSATAAQIDQVGVALETASVDDATGEALAAGMLTTLPAASAGFGGVVALEGLTGGGSEAPRARDPKVAAARAREAAAAAKDARATAERDRKTVETLTAKVAKAKEKVAELEGDLATAKLRASASAMEAKRAERTARRS
jgi:hypothetical protein